MVLVKYMYVGAYEHVLVPFVSSYLLVNFSGSAHDVVQRFFLPCPLGLFRHFLFLHGMLGFVVVFALQLLSRGLH